MNKVFYSGASCLTSIGKNLQENADNILKNKSGIKVFDDKNIYPEPVYLSKIENLDFLPGELAKFTKFESFAIFSIISALQSSNFNINDDTLLVLSSTKGNINLLKNELISNKKNDDIYLWSSAKKIANYFNIKTSPVIISNACISGVQALIIAMRYLKTSKYKNAIVVGADIISDFVVSGFMSFKSISKGACKPFDANRTGLSLGEGSAAILLTTNQNETTDTKIEFVSGATANDANHISAPSRTAEGLFNAIDATLQGNKNIDYISAHGTATPYNDDMESVALKRYGLENVPVNSLKSYFGHSLGATGVIETALGIYSMINNTAFKTLGFEQNGTIEKINVTTEHKTMEINKLLKIASGFGGSNAAIYLKKN